MKKNLLFLFALICSMGLFTACNNDDEPELPVEKDLAGAYKGDLGISINDQSLGSTIPQKVYISKSALGENQLKLELKAFMFGTMNLGDIQVDPCLVTEKGGTYSFSGSQTLTLADPIGTCPVTVEGSIEDGKIAINISVKVEALGQDVVAKFDGTKLSGSENTEAKITAFTFDDAIVTEQPVIDDAKGTITFKVSDTATDDDLKALTPVIVISDKAIVSPATGVAQNFSAGKSVTYTVIAEDGTVKAYQVSMAGSQNILKYSFEEWTTVGADKAEHEEPLPKEQLASSVEGASLLFLYGVEGFPVYKTDDKKEGNYAIKLVTMDTSAQANGLVPAITAGSLFTGKFDLNYMDWTTFDKLNCTRFGISYDKKPLRLKGWYKYTPGTKFLDGSDSNNIVEVPNKVDECAIQAVLYKIGNDDDVLTGHTINNSPERVAIAALQDGTAKADYTSFDIPFTYLEGKSYEEGAKYKLAIVCSSSKEGDYFKGAGGSTLILDELEIIGE